MKQELVQIPNGELEIQQRIRAIRGVQVMLDRDLAELYGVETKVLNQAVKRNADRFPPDFMIQLTKEECLRSQIVTLNESRGKHLKYLPYAFTEGGIAMLSSVLRSPTPSEIAKFNRQYKGLTVSYSDDFHDCFVIIDNVELHNLGSSINCLGRRLTTYTTRDAKEIRKILAQLP